MFPQPKWTKDDTYWLSQYYEKYGPAYCAAHLNISYKRAIRKAKQLGITFKSCLDGEKICSSCHTSQPLDAFFKSPKGTGGRHSYCKACYNIAQRELYASDPIFRLKRLLRRSVRRYMELKGSRYLELIGCTLDDFKSHIEMQFTEGMSWENIVLDHIIPLEVIRENPDKIPMVLNYRNFQPLSTEDNSKKSDDLKIALEYLRNKIEKFSGDETYEKMLKFLNSHN